MTGCILEEDAVMDLMDKQWAVCFAAAQVVRAVASTLEAVIPAH
jgi:hypothetical protein